MILCQGKPVTAMQLCRIHQALSHKAKRVIRFPGITAHAKALKVNRATLYRVLTGEWRLPTLSRRYQELIRRAS